jgi:Mg-chelatase subunit ChlD
LAGKGGKGSGKGTGKDSAAGAGGSSFFGFSADSNRVVFVVDVSGSMHGKRIRRAQTELRKTLEALKPSQKFYIVFFSDGAVPMPAAGLLSATSDNVAQASQWVQQAQCGGGTNPLPALLLALDLKPDAIYLLTDGKFPGQVLLAVTQDPPGHRTPIYTIAFASKKAERLLQAIANETGGSYRFVP